MTRPVTILGAGGIGGSLAHLLATAGLDVTCVEIDLARIDDGRRHGLRLDDRPAAPVRWLHFDDWTPGAGDRHLLCVKCFDNSAVLARLGPDAELLPIQNGIDARLESRGHPAGGIASYVAAAEPGRARVRITRRGDLHIGARGERPIPEWVRELAEVWRRAGAFRVVVVPRIAGYQHAKLMYNAAIAPLAAAAGLDNSALLVRPDARRLFFALLRENHAILTAAGKPLDKVGPLHPNHVARILARPWLARAFARAFVPSLRGTYCSMSGDIERGRTEVDYYNGVLAEWSGGAGPLNHRAVELIHRMTRFHIRPEPGVLAEFDSIA